MAIRNYHTENLGLTDDPEATGDGSMIGILKRIRTLIAGLGGIGSTLVLGQKSRVESLSVVMASDHGSVPITGSVQVTSAPGETFETETSQLPSSLGQKTKAESLSVTLPSDQDTMPVSGPLTNAQLRSEAVAVSGPLTNEQLRATPVDVRGPLTDTQLRATAVSVNGPLTDSQLRALPVAISGALTDSQLRATAVSVSPAGGSFATTVAQLPASLGSKTASASLSVVLASDASFKGLLPAERSATQVGTFYNADLGLHGGTVRWTYTIPVNKIGLLQSIWGYVAGASAGTQVQVGVMVDGIPVFEHQTTPGGVGMQVMSQVSYQLWLQTGATVSIFTYSGDNTTRRFQCGINILELA